MIAEVKQKEKINVETVFQSAFDVLLLTGQDKLKSNFVGAYSSASRERQTFRKLMTY